MKRLFVITYFALLTVLCSAQVFVTEDTKTRENSYNKAYENFWRFDDLCNADTLLLEDNTPVLLLRTPIRYMDGYTGLFPPQESKFVFTEHSGLGARGYLMTWRLKDKKLYLEKVWWDRREDAETAAKDGHKPEKGTDVLLKEIKDRVEQLTSRKFNKEGLLFADWVTERVIVVKHHPFQRVKQTIGVLSQTLDKVLLTQSDVHLSQAADNKQEVSKEVVALNQSQKIFALDFINGELRKIYKCVNIGEEQLLDDLHEKDKY